MHTWCTWFSSHLEMSLDVDGNGDKGIQFNRHYNTVEGEDADILSTVAFVFVT